MNAFPAQYELPHAPSDVEASILGGIILSNAALAVVTDLEVEDFYDNRHKVVFAAMRNLAAADSPIDVVLLEAEIARSGKLEAIGGVAFLGELTLRVPTIDNVEAYKNIVRVHALSRRMLIELGGAQDRIRRGVYEPRDILPETIGELTRMAEVWGPALGPAALRTRWIQPLESFLGNEEPDDNDAEDWIIRDLIPRGEAAIIAGPPKCGKTWSMLGIGIDAALGMSWLDSFEFTMGRPARVLCLAFEDGQRRLRKRVWELARARGVTPNSPILRANLSVGREPLSLPGDERAFAAELKAWKPDLVLIDNLTRVMVGDQNAIKDAKRFSDAWTKLCSDVGAAVVFLHHTSKVGPIQPDKRGMGDPFELIRGSGDLVASARHLVLMRPLESPDGTKLSDVRMRGNIDLRCEDFVLGFERTLLINRWSAKLSHRGETEAVHDELAAKRREKAADRKALRRGADGDNSVDERVYAKLVELHAGAAGDLCTLEQLKTSCNVRRQEVRPALDRLIHAGRVRADSVRRHEGGSWRTRAIFVPVSGGGS